MEPEHPNSELGQRIRLQDRKINVIIDVPKDEKLAYTYNNTEQPMFFGHTYDLFVLSLKIIILARIQQRKKLTKCTIIK